MNITNVRINPTTKESKIKAMASITFDDCFVVGGIKIIESDKGLFVSMPSNKITKDGKDEYKDICFPINKETREYISNTILENYQSIPTETEEEEEEDSFIPDDDRTSVLKKS